VALRRKDAWATLLAALVLLGLITAFAIELANTQAKDQQDVRARVHQRGELAAALINALFGTVTQNTATDNHLYGGPTVSAATLDKRVQNNAYLAVLTPSGTVLAHSKGFTNADQSALLSDSAWTLVKSGHPYGLGNVVAGPGGGVINFTVAFPTSSGTRILDTGFLPLTLNVFLGGDVKEIPGVRGEVNYVIDGNGMLLATSSKTAASGKFAGPHPTRPVLDFAVNKNGHYYDEVRLTNSTWRIVLDSPDGPLYASVSGLNKWLPWLIFGAFAVVAIIAFGLVGRVLSAVGETRVANEQLAVVNKELESTNEALAQRAAELARSNEELDQFASIASHDLQEPLRKIRTFTQELTRIESDSLSDKGRDYLSRANAAAERMQTLIEDLLRFSRVATAARPFTAVDLEQEVNEALEDLSDLVQRSGAVVHLGTLPTITADPLQMRQLIQNLISNAIKFQKPGGTPEVWIDSVRDGNDIQLSVRDNGIGFDPRYTTRIFRVFERLHGRNEYTGTGIGLALCRKIAERHGGTITANSQPDVGSTFTVTLPFRQRAVQPDPAAEQPDPAATVPATRSEANV
jgi:signal transduction histidine kinase